VQFLGASAKKPFDQMSAAINLGEDRELYDHVCKYRDAERVQRYLKTAPLKTMKKEVRGCARCRLGSV
jgi:hypothetical protein